MQVAVQPQCRAGPFGRGGGVLPDRADGVRVANQPQLGGRGEPLGEVFGSVGRRPPPPPRYRPAGAPSGAGRCRAVRKAAKVTAASAARVAGARSAGSPGTQVVTIQGRENRSEDSPRRCGTGIGRGRCGGEDGQPGVFLAQQHVRGPRRPRQPDGEIVAEPPHLVVPATRSAPQGAIRQVGVLLVQQNPNQFL